MDRQLVFNSISRVPVKVAAELGRAPRSLSEAIDLHPGEVLELEQGPGDPVDLYVDGIRYATGTLTQVEGNWAIRLVKIIVQPDDSIFKSLQQEDEQSEEIVDEQPDVQPDPEV